MQKELKEGDTAPAFSLESDNGEKISLKDLRGKVVVLFFYPKDMTPGCTQEACDFRDYSKDFKKAGAIVLGVSKDSVESHQKFIEKHVLSFPLLADIQGKACEAYGVWKEKSLYGRKYMGIERTTFVIGADGKVQNIFRKVKVKDHAKEILELLRSD